MKSAHRSNKLCELVSDTAMDGYTQSNKHLNYKGKRRRLAGESALFKTIEGKWSFYY